MQQSYKLRPPLFCINCSESGHISKQCTKPIVSYGCIAFRVNHDWNQVESILKGCTNIQLPIQYLMIQRKDSIGFVDFMRGKYRANDYDYIIKQIHGMTIEERERILTQPFDTLWDGLWGLPQEGFHAYRVEREQARLKLEHLMTATPSLVDIIRDAPIVYNTPEWGFPKGRRDMHESEYACAMREFYEETNLSGHGIYPIRNIAPLSETFTGSNSIQYCHKYFMAYVQPTVANKVAMVPESVNPHMCREIGDIRWCSYEEALALMRPTQLEKMGILTQVNSILRTYFPAIIGGCAAAMTPSD